MHCDEDSQHDDPFRKYIWWFDTYPMEFAEFLLTTALARGIWLHPLAANDVGYMDNVSIGEDLKQSGTLANDTKTSRAGRQNPGDCEVFLTTASNDFLIYNGCQLQQNQIGSNSERCNRISNHYHVNCSFKGERFLRS